MLVLFSAGLTTHFNPPCQNKQYQRLKIRDQATLKSVLRHCFLFNLIKNIHFLNKIRSLKSLAKGQIGISAERLTKNLRSIVPFQRLELSSFQLENIYFWDNLTIYSFCIGSFCRKFEYLQHFCKIICYIFSNSYFR